MNGKVPRIQTVGEEIANSITHGVGWAFSIAAIILLVIYSSLYGGFWRIISCSIYGIGLFLLYANSTLYHSLQARTAKKVFRILDHSSIYFLIAATYTPFTLITLRGPLGWTLFGIVWGGFVAGTVFKVFFWGRFKWLSVAVYILLGWSIILAIDPLVEKLPLPGLILLAGGGISYTIGVLIYIKRGVKYSHAIWHLYVLIGSILQFLSVLFYVIPG